MQDLWYSLAASTALFAGRLGPAVRVALGPLCGSSAVNINEKCLINIGIFYASQFKYLIAISDYDQNKRVTLFHFHNDHIHCRWIFQNYSHIHDEIAVTEVVHGTIYITSN